MRTNIVIDDKLIEKGMKYTGIRTKKELVNFAHKELIRRKERKRILGLINGLIIMTTSPSQNTSFPGLTGESRKALDARLRSAGMTSKQQWGFRKCQFNHETLNKG